MTIYAIVNGLAMTPQSGGPVWTLISPAAILQGGNPYFVPDFASRFEARPSLAVRIGKLGKGIAPRFAARYVDAVAPASIFVAADMLTRLQDNGLPWTPAISYDRSLAIGNFSKLDFDAIGESLCSITLETLETGGEDTATTIGAGRTITEVLTAISRDNTLKTGDIILLGLAGKGPEAVPGQKATLRLNDTESLRFNIR